MSTTPGSAMSGMSRRVCAAILLSGCVALGTLAGTSTASAAGDGGAGVGVDGHGDTIISSILGLGGGRGGGGGGGSGATPRCRWRTLSDDQVLFLLHVGAGTEGFAQTALYRAIASLGPAAAEVDVSVRFCDGIAMTDQVQVTPAAVLGGDLRSQARARLVTRLAAPHVLTSPPVGHPAVVNQPVFLSIGSDAWRPVDDDLDAFGQHVHVHAEPVGFDYLSGESGWAEAIESCEGPGAIFDPTSPLRVGAQAHDACVLRYHRATGRETEHIGYVQMRWDGWYSVDSGPRVPLSGLYSWALLRRSVIEVDTVIQHR